MKSDDRDALAFLGAVATQVYGSKARALTRDFAEQGIGGPHMKLTPQHYSADFWRDLLRSTAFHAVFTSERDRPLFHELNAEDWQTKISCAAANHCEAVLKNQAFILLPHHCFFPPLLRTVEHRPRAITCLGDLARLQDPLVSVVGSRKANKKALHESFRAGYELSRQGISIVSGGAYGCDIASHEGVIARGLQPCRAVVVFAGGLGFLYPRSHESLFASIVEGRGCLVSERLWATKPYRSDFPIRNRLIAGMAGLLLLMQAGDPSGAMITARLGLEYGNDIAVLKHEQHDVRAIGSHQLIEQGAFAFDRVDTLLPILRGEGGFVAENREFPWRFGID